MDVFRRSAAARVIYRGTLALPPLSLCHQALLSLFLGSSVFLYLYPSVFLLLLLLCLLLSFCSFLVSSPVLIRYTRVALREMEGFLMNATTESLFLLLPLVIWLSLFRFFTTLPPCLVLPLPPSFSLFLFLSLGLVSVVSATSFAPHINARFIPQNPGRYRIYIFVASL